MLQCWITLFKYRLKHTIPAVLNGGKRGEDSVSLPSSPLWQTPPQGVCPDHSLNELLPQHPIWRHPVPLLAHQLSSTQRFGIQVWQNVLSNVIQSPSWGRTTTTRGKHYLLDRQLLLLVQRYTLLPSPLLHAELDKMHRRAFEAKIRSEQCYPTSFGYSTTSH